MTHRSPHRTLRPVTAALLLALGAGGGAVAALAGAGCTAEQPSSLGGLGTSSTTTSGGGEGGGSFENHGEEMFAAMEADMVASCGGCHDAGGISNTPFLAGPDRYHTIVSWPGLVTKNPDQSLLLTHSVSGGGHSGTNLDAGDLATTLLPKVKDWLAEESKNIADPIADAGPQIDPMAPIMGFNAVYLGALGDEFQGMAITFNAETLTDSTLLLSEVEVHPTAKMGVHMVHPLFVVYPLGGSPDPDPVDSFSNVDQSFDVGQAGPLGPGTLVLDNWLPDAKLSIAFEKIEPYSSELPDAGDGGTTGGGCVDVGSFSTNAAPQLGTCKNTCHGGNNGQATSAVDMSKLGSDDAAACAQIKNRVNTGDPASSQLFVTTDPNGNAAHPYKFNGSDQAFSAFVDAVTQWIVAEQ